MRRLDRLHFERQRNKQLVQRALRVSSGLPATRVLLSLVDDLAAFPSDGLDQLLDFLFDAIAQIVRVHRVKLPAAPPVVGDEPLVARVLDLIGRRERGQPARLCPRQSNSRQLDVLALVLGESVLVWSCLPPVAVGWRKYHQGDDQQMVMGCRNTIAEG